MEPDLDITAVRADRVGVAFGRTQALIDISFDLAAGSSLALVGPNGSGKTTLLNVMAGLQEPTTGRLQRPDRVAYVLQHHARRHWLPVTVNEVLGMGRYGRRGLVGRMGPADHDAIDAAAQRLDVHHLGRRQFGELSGGQAQRVMVAQALAAEADLLLLDEPITGLDIPSQERILQVIDTEVRRGVTVAVSTHHLDEARHCDRAMLLDGRIVALDTPENALTPDRLREAYGDRVLAVHEHHDHADDLFLLDDHGHGTH